jgi:hypothetical protein
VPLVLRRLQHLQSFELGIGERMMAGWNEFHQPFREALLRLIQSPSVSRLEISHINDFPISVFGSCMNLADLTLARLTSHTMAVSYEKDSSAQAFAAPQLRSFAFRLNSGPYATHLLNARRPNGGRVLDFRNVQMLSVEASKEGDLTAVQALIRVTEKLETLNYNGAYQGSTTYISYLTHDSS